MPEVANISTALDKALHLLTGRQLAINPEIGIGYLFKFADAIENGTKAFEKADKIEILSAEATKYYSTADLYNMQDERLTSLPKDSIIKLHLNDYMSVNGDLCTMGVKQLADNLLFYKNNPNVIGAIFEVNSGGGEAMAGQILYNAILDFKKPVISLVNTAASAAYLGILSSKEIIASGELSRVGSIGAFISLDKKLVSQLKDRFEDIYSDLSSGKNAAIRTYLETGDTSIFKAELNTTVQAFHNLVLANRNVKKKAETLEGGMFLASEGKARGLVDLIGTESLAIKRLKTYIK
jgi:ClpP class serine protease